MDNLNNMTDHDALTTLIANVKTLTKSQEDFHREIRESFKNLQDNYSGRLDNHEARLQNLEVTRADFREKMQSNKTLMNVVIAIGVLLVGLFVYHVSGYHI